jgi:hypothetical protein
MKKGKQKPKKATKKPENQSSSASEKNFGLSRTEQAVAYCLDAMGRMEHRGEIIAALKKQGLAGTDRAADERLKEARARLRNHAEQALEEHKADSLAVLENVVRQAMKKAKEEPTPAHLRAAIAAVAEKAHITGEKIDRLIVTDPLKDVTSPEEAERLALEARALRERAREFNSKPRRTAVNCKAPVSGRAKSKPRGIKG